MFDIHHHGRSAVHNTTTIHERRAPTDESVRLLREMEKAALDKLLSITQLEGNTLNADWHIFEDYSRGRTKAICRMVLNGHEHRLTVELPRDIRLDPEKAAQTIHRAVIEELARTLTIDLFNQNGREIRTLR